MCDPVKQLEFDFLILSVYPDADVVNVVWFSIYSWLLIMFLRTLSGTDNDLMSTNGNSGQMIVSISQ